MGRPKLAKQAFMCQAVNIDGDMVLLRQHQKSYFVNVDLSCKTVYSRLSIIGEQTKEAYSLQVLCWFQQFGEKGYLRYQAKSYQATLQFSWSNAGQVLVSSGSIHWVIWQGCWKAVFMATRWFFMSFCWGKAYISSFSVSKYLPCTTTLLLLLIFATKDQGNLSMISNYT